MLKLRGLDDVILVRLPYALRCLGHHSETVIICRYNSSGRQMKVCKAQKLFARHDLTFKGRDV